MAFIPHTHDDGQPKPFEYLPAGAGLALEPGTALVFASGVLALATGATKPTYICQAKIEATEAGQTVPVIRVDGDCVFETELSEASTGIARGEKYTIDATGGKLTATAEGGVAEVVCFEGTATGSKVRVRF